MHPEDERMLKQSEQELMILAAKESGDRVHRLSKHVEQSLAIAPLGPIGHVPMVNGADAEAVPGFVASGTKLLVLVKHWMLEKLDAEFGMFSLDYVGSNPDARNGLRRYANRPNCCRTERRRGH